MNPNNIGIENPFVAQIKADFRRNLNLPIFLDGFIEDSWQGVYIPSEFNFLDGLDKIRAKIEEMLPIYFIVSFNHPDEIVDVILAHGDLAKLFAVIRCFHVYLQSH